MKLIRKTDIYIIVVVSLIAFAAYFGITHYEKQLKAVVSVDGKIVGEVNLSDNEKYYEIKPKTDLNVTIAVDGNTIYFKESDCPDKLCVKCGKLSKRGDTAVCLPARTVVTILGSDVDAVTF